MRELTEIARRLLETRRTVKELERAAAAAETTEKGGLSAFETIRLSIYRGAMQGLAWALDVDLSQIDTPPTLAGMQNYWIEPTTHVQLHRIDVGNEVGVEPHERRVMWLVEIPAHHDADDAGYNTEAWSCFLSQEQAEQLHQALGDVLPARLPEPVRLPGLRCQPDSPDIEGGYAGELGSAGGRHLPPPPASAAPSRGGRR